MLPSEIGHKQKIWRKTIAQLYIWKENTNSIIKKKKTVRKTFKIRWKKAIKIKKSIRNHGSGGMYTHTHTKRERFKFARTTNYNKQQKL